MTQTQMARLASVGNFTLNIKPTMEKVRDKKKLTEQDLKSILDYYIEVVNLMAVFNS